MLRTAKNSYLGYAEKGTLFPKMTDPAGTPAA